MRENFPEKKWSAGKLTCVFCSLPVPLLGLSNKNRQKTAGWHAQTHRVDTVCAAGKEKPNTPTSLAMIETEFEPSENCFARAERELWLCLVILLRPLQDAPPTGSSRGNQAGHHLLPRHPPPSHSRRLHRATSRLLRLLSDAFFSSLALSLRRTCLLFQNAERR